MTDEHIDAEELTLVRTCHIRQGDDLVAMFVIDGRRYRDPLEVRGVYNEAWDEMNRRWVGCEWETHAAGPTEPASLLPSWEEYRVGLDGKHPLPEGE